MNLRPTFLLKALTWLAILSPLAASASTVQCKDLFRVDSQLFIQTEGFRDQLLTDAKFVLMAMQIAGSKATAEVQVEIERRDGFEPARMQRAIDSSVTLKALKLEAEDARWARSKLPPAIESTTMDLILDGSTPAKVLSAALHKDPYFQWLKHNSLSYERDQNDNLKNVFNGKGTSPNQADPIPLLIQYRKEGMSPDLALIRLMRNMDPVLSAPGFRSANAAIVNSLQSSVLIEKVIPYLAARETRPELDAWLLVPSFKAGTENLQKLLDQQVAKFGALFPRRAFEKLLNLNGRHDIALDVIGSYRLQRIDRIGENAIIANLDQRLNFLRTKLGLPAEFPQSRLYDIIDKIISLQAASSYEAILADVFDPAAGRMIRELRMILEISDAFSRTANGAIDGRRLNTYLTGKVLNEEGSP